MKGWLRLGLLFLIIASCIVIVNVSAKSTNYCGTIHIGQTADISKCVSPNTQVGWWVSSDLVNNEGPVLFIVISNPQSFSVTSNMATGIWYVVDPVTRYGDNKVFKIANKNKTD